MDAGSTGIDAVPITTWPFVTAFVLAGVLVLVAVVLGVRRAGRSRHRSVRVLARLGATGVAAVVLLANALVGVNAGLDYLRTVGDVAGTGPAAGIGVAQLLLSRRAPATGQVVQVPIPGRASHFAARPAVVWVPPAWYERPRPQLPVIVLLHGTPGRPADWVDSGGAADVADAWAAQHHGVAPVLVMPDVNGSYTADSECVDTPTAQVETYLTRDVPRVVSRLFGTRPPGASWAVAGLSEGGSCAVMLALRHPTVFATFGDYAGLLGPRVGDSNGGVADTVAGLFGGSPTAFAAHDPATLLATNRVPGLAGWFEVGDADTDPAAAAVALSAAATRAGVGNRLVVVPGGGHDFDLFSRALSDSYPWLVGRVSAPAP
ncbi:alpha/beta hydrolase family protein [Pseudonocardia sp. ICBG1293]|uniref:alpha/beta hydrolase n=1 Tax=Pseudonocardia sp. ICBG1293 TaxID=2844382 RepID=UPI001CCD4500|nr:alpha/beta hydrolase-fold protein [Pseudonocardia sp. ICBG1293]